MSIAEAVALLESLGSAYVRHGKSTLAKAASTLAADLSGLAGNAGDIDEIFAVRYAPKKKAAAKKTAASAAPKKNAGADIGGIVELYRTLIAAPGADSYTSDFAKLKATLEKATLGGIKEAAAQLNFHAPAKKQDAVKLLLDSVSNRRKSSYRV